MKTPVDIEEFLKGKRIAIAGVSRTSASAANAIYRKLVACGYEVLPINPNAAKVEGVASFPDLASVPGTVDGLVVVTHPDAAAAVVRQAVAREVRNVWFHRSFGQGSVSAAAVQLCRESGLRCIVGGCPLLYCQPVDFGHRCMRAWLQWRGRLPA